MSQYSKNLMGLNASVFVSPAIEYTDDTTYGTFVANAVEGEVGVFLADLTRKTTALTAGQQFFIAQKRDGRVRKTPLLNFNDITSKRRTAYDAPVKQIQHVGFVGTGTSDLTFNFTGASATAPQEYSLSLRDTTPGNQPFPVQEGRAVVTSATANEYTVLAQIVSQLNSDFDYEKAAGDPFVVAEILQSTTTTAITVAATLAVQNGSTTVVFNAAPTGAPVVGEYIAIGGTAQLGSVYKIVAIPTTTQYVLDRPYAGATNAALAIANVLKAPFVSGTSLLGVKLTAINFESHFVVTAGDLLNGSPIVISTAWKQGSGAYSSVVEMEKQGIIFSGVGSTVNAEFSADYGYPTLFSSSALTYDLFFIDLLSVVIPSAGLPEYRSSQIQRIVIAAPTGGTTPGNELQTIFGL